MRYTRHDNLSDASSAFADDDDNGPLSPTDGYFATRSHPQELFVERPNTSNTVSPSNSGPLSTPKSRPITPSTDTPTQTQPSFRTPSISNGDGDGDGNEYYYYVRRSPPLLPRGNRSPGAFSPDEWTPLLQQSSVVEPPPPYDDTMRRGWGYGHHDAARREPHGGSNGNGNGGGGGGNALLAVLWGGARWRRGPEAMASRRYWGGGENARLYAAPRRKRRWRWRRCLKTLIAVLGVVVLVLWIAMAVKKRRAEDPFERGAFWPLRCGSRSATRHEVWDFDSPPEFRYVEAIEARGRRVHNINGETHFVPAPPDQTSNIRMKFAITASGSLTVRDLLYEQLPAGIELAAAYLDPAGGTTACLAMLSVFYVKPGLSLRTLNIDSRHTKVIFHTGLNLTVEETATITLGNGGLSTSPGSFESRDTVIDIVNGGVTGTYSLLDLLSIKTQSGSITVTVEPKEADPKKPKPADLQVRSRLGSINVKYKVQSLPERDYKALVDARTGSFTGNLVHGSATSISATSGSIMGNILPYNASDAPSTLSTHTLSGSTRITLLPPYLNPGTDISRLKSEHRGKSGSIALEYPQEWTGTLEGGTTSGSLTLRGKDLRIIREGGGVGGKRVLAKKGIGESEMSFETTSGSCSILVGNA